MVEISLYSNDSRFLADAARELSVRLGEAFRLTRHSLIQMSLFDFTDTVADLCLVDLRDDPLANLDFISRLRQNQAMEIMVVAPGPEWAMAAYDLDVLSYFPEPFNAARCAQLILRRFSTRVPPPETQFPFRTATGTVLVAAERIVYVEYADHKLVLHTDTEKRIVTSTMRASFGQASAALLADPRFVRTHASYLVNITHVQRFENFTLQMDTGARVPVSHAKKAEVKRQFNAFYQP